MYCSKCGTELPEGAKFCLKCGQKIVDATIFDKAQEISNELKNIIEADIITESEKTTKINSLSYKLKIKFANLWNNLNKFSKIVIVCLTISILLCFISFVSGRIFSGIISLIQIGLLLAAYLINNKILNIKNEYLHLWLVIAAIILIIPYFCLFKFDITSMDFSIDSEKTNSSEILEEFQWPNNELTNMLPAPKSNIGYIQQDSPYEFSIYVAKTSKEDYKDYIEECSKNGFTNIVLEKADFYSVNKEDGYRLVLEYKEENAMIITIKVPSYSVLIEMDCISNLIFNKYNIDVYIDGNKIAALQHGNQDTLEIELDKGSHTLKVTKENESSISGAAAFDVSDTIKISFELYCQSDKITLTEKYIEILSPLAEGQVKIPASSEDYKSQIYESAVAELRKAGFTNINTSEIQDLAVGLLKADGQIEKISIGGKTEIKKAEIFDKDVEIIITYHTFMPEIEDAEDVKNAQDSKEESNETQEPAVESEQALESIIEQLNPYIGKPITELIPVLSEMGFTATYTAENSGDDFTEWIKDDEAVREVFVTRSFQNINVNTHTLEVMMLSKEMVAELEVQKALNEKLDEYIAWEAVEKYGKANYTSFKLHYMTGKLGATVEDENTWFLKALCDWKTPYGSAKKVTCEAKVTGTNGRPQVIYFEVY